NFSAWPSVNVFAADSAGRTRTPGHAMCGVQLFAGQIRGPLETSLLEVARRQGGEAIESEQVRHRAQLTVLRRCRAERPSRQVFCGSDDRGRISDGDALRPGHCQGLEAL